jgi:hypothetical protein
LCKATVDKLWKYPRRIAIPDDLNATEVRFEDAGKQRTHVVFPIGIYYSAHYQGWQMFLSAVKDRGVRATEEEFTTPILAVNEPYTFRGMEAGYNECKSVCRQLARAHVDDELKDMAARCNRPVIIAPDRVELGPNADANRPASRW